MSKLSRNLVNVCVIGLMSVLMSGVSRAAESTKRHSELFAAIERQDIRGVRRLLASGVSPNAKDADGQTALDDAVLYGNLDIVGALVSSGGRVDPVAVYYSVSATGERLTRYLIEHGGTVNFVDEKGEEAFWMASVSGDFAEMDLLYAHGARINLPDESGQTPLINCVDHSEVESVRWLLMHHADMRHRDYSHMDALDYAAYFLDDGSPAALRQWLMLRSAAGHGFGRMSTLGDAVVRGDVASVKRLLAAGADPNSTTVSGIRLLDQAALDGRGDLVDVLLASGAKPTGEALTCASCAGGASLVQSLLTRGAPLHYVTDNGWEPFCWAASNGHVDVMQVLYDKGAKVDRKSKVGMTPLMYAVTAGSVESVRWLLAHHADVRAQDKSGTSVLPWARNFLANGSEKNRAIEQMVADAVRRTPKG